VRLILTVALLLLAPQAPAQQPVIGYLGAESPERFASRLEAFRKGLAEAGFTEGRNVAIEYRWAHGDNSKLPALVGELVQRRVAVLVAPGSAVSAMAAKKATATIPIVFETGLDPVAAGLVQSMSRPGGNATGVSSLNTPLMAKRFELLAEMLPAARSFALLVNPTNPGNAEAVTMIVRAAAGKQQLQAHVVQASRESEFSAAFETASQLGAGGLVIANDTFFVTRNSELAALSLRHRVPAVHTTADFVRAGGLASYAGSSAESHRLAGVYAGRVLRGEKPADLPVQQVQKTEFYVNAKTAKALGITVPAAVLVRADHVIQ
jgi:putative ABC transport system substrate-binding protein